MRECRVSSSDRLKRFPQFGNVHSWGFSPVLRKVSELCGPGVK
jgi:hypothetical protein